MRAFSARTGIALVCLLLLASTGSALLMDLSKEELIDRSDHIILAKVLDIQTAWADDHSQIFTYVELEISDQFKGNDLGKELVIQIPGGTVGEITQVTSDTPKNLEVGAEVILHLFMKETGYYWVYGWEKGSLSVHDNSIPDYLMTVEQFRNLVERTLK